MMPRLIAMGFPDEDALLLREAARGVVDLECSGPRSWTAADRPTAVLLPHHGVPSASATARGLQRRGFLDGAPVITVVLLRPGVRHVARLLRTSEFPVFLAITVQDLRETLEAVVRLTSGPPFPPHASPITALATSP